MGPEGAAQRVTALAEARSPSRGLTPAPGQGPGLPCGPLHLPSGWDLHSGALRPAATLPAPLGPACRCSVLAVSWSSPAGIYRQQVTMFCHECTLVCGGISLRRSCPKPEAASGLGQTSSVIRVAREGPWLTLVAKSCQAKARAPRGSCLGTRLERLEAGRGTCPRGGGPEPHTEREGASGGA